MSYSQTFSYVPQQDLRQSILNRIQCIMYSYNIKSTCYYSKLTTSELLEFARNLRAQVVHIQNERDLMKKELAELERVEVNEIAKKKPVKENKKNEEKSEVLVEEIVDEVLNKVELPLNIPLTLTEEQDNKETVPPQLTPQLNLIDDFDEVTIEEQMIAGDSRLDDDFIESYDNKLGITLFSKGGNVDPIIFKSLSKIRWDEDRELYNLKENLIQNFVKHNRI